MLQQTQASRIAEMLPVFLERYPTVDVLAKATNAEIIRSWKGLGYNSRALRLRDAARSIVQDHGGVVPDSLDDLRNLPGVGPYTSAAVASFAYKKRVIVIDVNIRRVYSRWMKERSTTIDVASDKEVEGFAELVIPKRAPDEWHHAVMDLGSTFCTARKPTCSDCPVQRHCPSANTMRSVTPTKRPEPMIRNEPRRIWRGRIVDALRDHDKGLTKRALIKAVFGDVDATEQLLVDDVLVRLENDGITSTTKTRVVLAAD